MSVVDIPFQYETYISEAYIREHFRIFNSVKKSIKINMLTLINGFYSSLLITGLPNSDNKNKTESRACHKQSENTAIAY